MAVAGLAAAGRVRRLRKEREAAAAKLAAAAPPASADVVVVGAGVVGAACAYFAARAGLRVVVVDRGPVAGGTTSAGEGNLLISDKAPGPEVDLMRHSLALWDALDIGDVEHDRKGGLVVAATAEALESLRALGSAHRDAGVEVTDVAAADLAEYEPEIATGLAGGAHYPQDAQVQPMLAAAHLLRASSAAVRTGVAVTDIERAPDGRVTGVRTTHGRVAAPAVVNAAGTWAAEVARLAGVEVPIMPRRGFILVTEPVGVRVRHKVYAADYMATVASDDGDLQVSAVVEGTRAGTILVGSSRERVGFDATMSLPVLRRLAAHAVELFPFLAGVHAIRAYRGFRPYSPDHLPVIGPDPRVPGLLHAGGHEGAGIGLAPATGDLVASFLTGAPPAVDPTPFAPSRFVA
jgi:glycine/D-amino acid oxidase-like deaminating enzyme